MYRHIQKHDSGQTIERQDITHDDHANLPSMENIMPISLENIYQPDITIQSLDQFDNSFMPDSSFMPLPGEFDQRKPALQLSPK